MKIFRFKNLFRMSSLLNILGISAAVAAFYVLVVCVDFDVNFNKEIPDYQRIYMLVHNNEGVSNYERRPLGETVISDMPFVETGGCLAPWGSINFFADKNGKPERLALSNAYCSKTFLETFGVKILEGSLESFSEPNSIVVSRSAAENFSLSAGGTLSGGDTLIFKIAAVFEDFPKNSELGEFKVFANLGNQSINSLSEGSYIYYIKAKEGVSGVEEKLKENSETILRKIYAGEMDDFDEEDLEWFEEEVKGYALTGIPLDELHFYPEIYGYHVRADKKIVWTLFVIAIMTVIIAYINYLNFFFSQIPQKLKAVNIKKIYGCSRAGLILTEVLESVVFSFVALGVAYLIVRGISASPFGAVIGKDLALTENIKIAVMTFFSVTLISVLTSIYPAVFITGVQPALALKGTVNSNPKSKLRYILIGFQFTASVALIISTSFIKENNDYMLSKDLGFNKENLLSTVTTDKIATSRETVREKLMQNTAIEDIAWADGDIIGKQRMGWGRELNGKYIDFQCYPVSWNFLRFLGVEVPEGRDFTENDEKCENGVFIFNETAKKRFNLTLDTKVHGHIDETDIAGFCKDFNYKPLQYGIEPFAFYVMGANPWRAQLQLYLRIKAGSNLPSVVDFVKETLTELDPDYETLQRDVITFDRETAYNYTQETNLAMLVTLFTFAVLLIALTGLLGVVLFETERRRKEIGIRKVNGATVKEILLLFNKKFAALVLISFVIACPIAYYVVVKYLANFTYHCPVYVWVFVAALIRALVLTALTVTAASFKAANENPVRTLKSE